VNVQQFLIVVAVGAGAIALWIDTRFPRFAPKEIRRAVVHVGVSILIGQLAVPLLIKTIAAGGSPVAVLFAIFGIGFPALTYCLLASIWIIKVLQGALRHR
jgi:hypothetical protein